MNIFMDRSSKTSRGRWLGRERFYSICSRHMGDNQDDCALCKIGQWRNVYLDAVSHRVFKLAPRLWRWWTNRKPLKLERRDGDTV